MSLRIVYLGNFSVQYSTESHVAASFEALGHEVIRIQEGQTRALDVPLIVRQQRADLFFHTQTYGLAVSGGSYTDRLRMVLDIREFGVPSVAYHLDLWRGLDREGQVDEEPYFYCDHFFSTDGGDPSFWTERKVNHHWLPPGVYHAEAYDGTPRDIYHADIAFVGSHRGYGHAEHWAVREKMLRAVSRRYRRRFRLFPLGKAVRGTDLTDLYASVKVVIGDSCLAGKVPGYWSDRVPETTGRGGFLIHPRIERLDEVHPYLVTYPPEDWDALIELIDHYLHEDEARETVRVSNATHTRKHHTYMHRMKTVLEVVELESTGPDDRNEDQQQVDPVSP